MLNTARTVLLWMWILVGMTVEMSGEVPSMEEMWRIIQEQQAEIERMRGLLEAEVERGEEVAVRVESSLRKAEGAERRGAELEGQVEATAEALEELVGAESWSGGTGWWERTRLGGYGELHANFWGKAGNEIDFHRFVLFVNHRYNDRISLFSELELEHALSGEGKEGEVELEQAYIRFELSDRSSAEAGLFLMPVGILNETHEPDTFYGVERNNIETRLIPSTWWEGGVKGNWRFGNGISVDAGVTSGLDSGAGGNIRGGRQKVSEALNESMGFVGRIKYSGIPGLEMAVSAYYQNDLGQSVAVDYSGLLTTGHLQYRRGGFQLRALYARWDLDGEVSPDAEEQDGYYVEPSYRWELSNELGSVGVYFRYSDYRYYSGRLLDNQIHEIGLNYWPVPHVVLKADLQDVSGSDQYRLKGDSSFNLGLGYQF